MKTCSKCKKDLPRENFVKSSRYKDGLYPSCKDCRKATQQQWLDEHPMCAKCGKAPHTPAHRWCYDCQRELDKRNTKPPKFHRDVNNKLCSFCKSAPRQRNHNYCKECQLAYNRGVRKPAVTQEERRKETARRYILRLHQKGKFPRLPCEMCGKPSEEFHHLDYEPKTKHVRHLCRQCHKQVERVKKSMLTEQPLIL